MTRALLRHYVAMARRSPVHRTCVIAAAAVGAISTLYPVGVRVPGSAPGALGGAGFGAVAALVLLPFCAVLLLLATSGADEDLGLVDEFRLAGVPSARRWSTAGVAAVVGGIGAVCVAPLAGATAGLGDSLRTHSALVGHGTFPSTAAVFALATTAYFVVIASGFLVATRSPVQVAIAMPLGFGIFLVLFQLFPAGSWTRWLLRLTPFGPVWSSALPEGRAGYILTMSVTARAVVAAGWFVAGLVLAVLRLRREAVGR